MSRLCAKPTCAEPATAWLLLDPGNRWVTEHAKATNASLALCEQHRDRFTVPAGWTFEQISGDASIEIDASVEVEAPVAVAHDAEPTPWFLAAQAEAKDDAPPRPLLEGASRTGQELPDVEVGGGSLLQRAFHGPDRAADLARLDNAERTKSSTQPVPSEVDELESRRAARMVDEYGTAQLPFPPLDEGQRVAVS